MLPVHLLRQQPETQALMESNSLVVTLLLNPKPHRNPQALNPVNPTYTPKLNPKLNPQP